MRESGRVVVKIEDPKLLIRVLDRLKKREIPRSFSSPLTDEIVISDKLPKKGSRGFWVVVDDESLEGKIELVKLVIKGKIAYNEICVGIDPGSPTIMAVVGDGEVIDVYKVGKFEEIVETILKIYNHYPYKDLKVKVGSGSGFEEIIGRLSQVVSKIKNVKLQLVDEKYTSRETPKPRLKVGKKEYAAINIALRSGVEVEVHGRG